jgi:small subunit ribosomal protein S20
LFSALTGLAGANTFPPLNFFNAMANTKSALKYIRKTETRTLRNRQAKSRLKTFAKKVEAAKAAEDKDALAIASRQFISALDKASKSGLVHPNKVARHKARCAQLLAA